MNIFYSNNEEINFEKNKYVKTIGANKKIYFPNKELID